MLRGTLEIVICLGSSCFARGNKKTLSVIQQYIKDNNLENIINFRGNHCFGKCNNGPIIKINEKEYESVYSEDVLEIIEKELAEIRKI